jgi:hypothetical protein
MLSWAISITAVRRKLVEYIRRGFDFAALGSASTSVHNFSLAGADKGIDG